MNRKPINTNKSISSYISSDLERALKNRAENLKFSLSRVSSEILQNWYDSGCPPINDLDAALQLVKKAKAEGKSLAEIGK